MQLATPSSGDEVGDNSKARGPRTLDNHRYNNFPHVTLMLWIPVQLHKKPSLKRTKKDIGRKAAASNVINKATLQGIALARKLVLAQQKPWMCLKLLVWFQKPSPRKPQLPALPPELAN